MNHRAVVDLSDAELGRRIAAQPGSARAEEAELCRRFGARVRLYGLRHLGDEDSAAELTQRVLLRALEKLRAGAVREPDRLASFVLGTARHVCLELRRGERRSGVQDPERVARAVSPALSDPEPDTLDRLARCVEGLSERERSVVLLTFFQQQSARAIGAALGASEGNVRVIRHRAVQRLRDCMGAGEAS